MRQKSFAVLLSGLKHLCADISFAVQQKSNSGVAVPPAREVKQRAIAFKSGVGVDVE